MKIVLSMTFSFFLVLFSMAEAKIQMPSAEQLASELMHAGCIRVVEKSAFVNNCADKLLEEDSFFESVVSAITAAYEIGDGTCFDWQKGDFIYGKGCEVIEALINYFADKNAPILEYYYYYVDELVILHRSC
jgi:hypothetical protein